MSCTPRRTAICGKTLQCVLILGRVLTRVVDLEAGLGVAEKGFPVAVYGVGVGGWGAEIGPGLALVGGNADGDAVVGVCSCVWVS